MPYADEAAMIAALRRGDETAFAAAIDLYGPAMLRLARYHVRDRAAAEEVVQEAWLGVLTGLDRFEGRSSLKTWIFRIVANRAKTRGERESRSAPFSALARRRSDHDEPAVDADRFLPPTIHSGRATGPPIPTTGSACPRSACSPRRRSSRVADAIATLPATQREVVRLRDVEGWDSKEVCDLLEISEGNQRVLLHRGRSKVRAALEPYLADAA